MLVEYVSREQTQSSFCRVLTRKGISRSRPAGFPLPKSVRQRVADVPRRISVRRGHFFFIKSWDHGTLLFEKPRPGSPHASSDETRVFQIIVIRTRRLPRNQIQRNCDSSVPRPRSGQGPATVESLARTPAAGQIEPPWKLTIAAARPSNKLSGLPASLRREPNRPSGCPPAGPLRPPMREWEKNVTREQPHRHQPEHHDRMNPCVLSHRHPDHSQSAHRRIAITAINNIKGPGNVDEITGQRSSDPNRNRRE